MSTLPNAAPAGAEAHLPDEALGAPLLHIEGGTATITLNRPQHLNRLHRADLLVLQDYLTQLAAHPELHAVVITATGRAFCAGYHIGELDTAPTDAPAGPQLFEQTVDLLERLPLPTICLLNGSVYGGATDLALACDFRLGVSTLELRMPAARLGLHYYPSGLVRYSSRLGLGAAKRLFLLAEAVPANELLRIGYLDDMADVDHLPALLQRYLDALAAGAPLALRGMKQALNEFVRGDWVDARVRERETLCASSADLREGLTAWRERRLPRFEGR
jgi:enoyl-CoA hydratase/carnithine racemase